MLLDLSFEFTERLNSDKEEPSQASSQPTYSGTDAVLGDMVRISAWKNMTQEINAKKYFEGSSFLFYS